MSAVGHLAVIRNPFSTAQTSPKIPDGLVSASTGQRLHSCKQVTCTDDSSTFLLFPGLSSNAIFYSDLVETVATVTKSSPEIFDFKNNGAFGNEDLTTAAVHELEFSDEPEKWRQVSCGARISLVNNSEENDGWFEACRFAPGFNSDDFTLLRKNTENRRIYPLDTIESSFIGGGGLVNHNSYISGKLRDIHKHCFYLQNQNGTHDFKMITDKVKLGLEAAAQVGTNDVTGKTVVGNKLTTEPDNLEIVKTLIDSDFDFVVVRIHGTKLKTKLMIHTVSNQEQVYGENQKLSRFHSKSLNYIQGLLATERLLKSDPKPSLIRNPNSGAVRLATRSSKRKYKKRRR